MEINLISDTVTRPTPAMLDAMMAAQVGDDVFREDPTVNALEAHIADLFGKEAAIFCPSGTMCNQIALQLHTQALDEVLCDELSHIYQAELNGYAHNARIGIRLLKGNNGKITAPQIAEAIQPNYDWMPRTALLSLENTCNKGGGNYYTLAEISPISALCREKGLKMHLDGARLFHALVETNETPEAWGAHFDTLSICLSKGLGAPVGSLLLGSQADISRARRFRKIMGGGMRQAGFLAAAGLFALQNNVQRLKDDHYRARKIAETLADLPFVANIRPVLTNIVLFDVEAPYTPASFVEALRQKGVKSTGFGGNSVRFVTHLDFTAEMLEKAVDVLRELSRL